MLAVVGEVLTQAVDLGHRQSTETSSTIGHHPERRGEGEGGIMVEVGEGGSVNMNVMLD